MLSQQQKNPYFSGMTKPSQTPGNCRLTGVGCGCLVTAADTNSRYSSFIGGQKGQIDVLIGWDTTGHGCSYWLGHDWTWITASLNCDVTGEAVTPAQQKNFLCLFLCAMSQCPISTFPLSLPVLPNHIVRSSCLGKSHRQGIMLTFVSSCLGQSHCLSSTLSFVSSRLSQ